MMFNGIKIPRGWRVLRKGMVIHSRDKYWVPATGIWRSALEPIGFVGDRVGDNFGDLDVQPWIRRVVKKRKVAKK